MFVVRVVFSEKIFCLNVEVHDNACYTKRKVEKIQILFFFVKKQIVPLQRTNFLPFISYMCMYIIRTH